MPLTMGKFAAFSQAVHTVASNRVTHRSTFRSDLRSGEWRIRQKSLQSTENLAHGRDETSGVVQRLIF